MGVIAYIGQVTMGEEAMAALSQAERAWYETMPTWATTAFAVAVWGGALGTLALVLKKAWALPVLAASLIGIGVQMYHSIFVNGAMEVYGPRKNYNADHGDSYRVLPGLAGPIGKSQRLDFLIKSDK